jgi:hypothetical protein
MNNMNNIACITIQKYARVYLENLIMPSLYQTKEWRKARTWYKGGKCNECEKYQIKCIEKITGTILTKTDARFYMKTYEIINIKYPMKKIGGYEYTENFDGLLIKNSNKYYFNLKFVCDKGGAQTRTLREVYHFIKCQLYYLIKFNNKNTYFINILDGDECSRNMAEFLYLLNDEEYKEVKNYVFVGSLYDFKKKSASLIV